MAKKERRSVEELSVLGSFDAVVDTIRSATVKVVLEVIVELRLNGRWRGSGVGGDGCYLCRVCS